MKREKERKRKREKRAAPRRPATRDAALEDFLDWIVLNVEEETRRGQEEEDRQKIYNERDRERGSLHIHLSRQEPKENRVRID